MVATRDPKTGKAEFRKVIRTFSHLAHETITAQFADAKTGQVVETLTATPEHPFFVAGQGFAALGSLGVGTLVVTRAGPPLVVKSLARQHSEPGVLVYNLEVEGDHTYFVGNHNDGIWVHNNCFTEDQQALIALAKAAFRRSRPGAGIASDEAKTLLQWAKEYGLPARGWEVHPNRPNGQFPHIHIGPIDHIWVQPW